MAMPERLLGSTQLLSQQAQDLWHTRLPFRWRFSRVMARSPEPSPFPSASAIWSSGAAFLRI